MDMRQKLAEPFKEAELRFFPTALSGDKKKGKVAAYADARTFMDRFDDVCSPGGWSTSYRCIDPADKAVECTISVFYDGHWVSKADVGYPNDAKDADDARKEPWKAAYSDAFKRAAVQHGVGRYIYHLEFAQDWVEVDEWGKFKTQPRLKGQAPAPEQAPRPAQTPTAARPAPTQTSKPPTPTFMQWAASVGYDPEFVKTVSTRMFGPSIVPNQLNVEDKKKLALALEEEKKAVSRA